MLRKVLPAILFVIAASMANADKISGFVTGTPKGKTFVVGAKGGPYNVDASKATVTLNGKFFSLAKLTGGSQVTVEGTLKGKSMMAKTVKIGSLRGATKTAIAKPSTKPSSKPKMDSKTKPTSKPMKDMKGMKPATKMTAKPKSTTKPASKATTKPATKTTKPTSKTKSKAKGKTDDKSKAKTGN